MGFEYGSRQANGWMGVGWDAGAPSIGVDTRWGVPRYDRAVESETYSFEGEQLSPTAHRSPQLPREAERLFAKGLGSAEVKAEVPMTTVLHFIRTKDKIAAPALLHPDLDLILIESGGDNLAATFSPELVDATIYVIDVADATRSHSDVVLGASPRASLGLLHAAQAHAAITGGAAAVRAEELLDHIRRLRERGVAMLYITHRLEEMFAIGDWVTILRDGRTVETIDMSGPDATQDRIIRGMVGRDLESFYPDRVSSPGEEVLRVEDWTVWHPTQDRKVVDNASFTVRAGEVVGIAGLMGAGRTELAMSIFGRSYGRDISGRVFIRGKEVKARTVSEAISRGPQPLRRRTAQMRSCSTSQSIRGLVCGRLERSSSALASRERSSSRWQC